MKLEKAVICLVLTLVICGVTGCSKLANNLKARVSLYRAEQVYWNAIKMKSKGVSFEERKPVYTQACDLYLKVLELSTHIFNAGKIEEAWTSCYNAENFPGADRLKLFNEAYCKEHPKECAYGIVQTGIE